MHPLFSFGFHLGPFQTKDPPKQGFIGPVYITSLGGSFYPSSSLGFFLGGISGSCPAPLSRNTTRGQHENTPQIPKYLIYKNLGSHGPLHSTNDNQLKKKNESIFVEILSFIFNENYI
jgi:hypothetical protein